MKREFDERACLRFGMSRFGVYKEGEKLRDAVWLG
jgi:hypothetical protein